MKILQCFCGAGQGKEEEEEQEQEQEQEEEQKEEQEDRYLRTIEMFVHMDSSRCEHEVWKALNKFPGVDYLDIDLATQKVTVMGYVQQEEVLEAVRKTERRATLWPFPYGAGTSDIYQYQPYTRHPTHQLGFNPYDYRMHGYNNDDNYLRPGYSSTIVDEHAYDDENHTACSIM